MVIIWWLYGDYMVIIPNNLKLQKYQFFHFKLVTIIIIIIIIIIIANCN